MMTGYDSLEIGGGVNATPGYLQIDIDANVDPDIVADVRAIFTPDVKLEDYPDLEPLADLGNPMFSRIKAIHFIEHVQWLYQEAMFQWFFALLYPGGVLELETPDLMWIAKSYIKNKKKSKFPLTDHPTLNKPQHFVPWVNFKLYSGCSLGDYHHCMYDKEHLGQSLKGVGFNAKIKARGGHLYASAIKPNLVTDTGREGGQWFQG